MKHSKNAYGRRLVAPLVLATIDSLVAIYQIVTRLNDIEMNTQRIKNIGSCYGERDVNVDCGSTQKVRNERKK